ncbi:hypothetical protein GCM10007925_13600 [Sphingomonas astaxanthinifaciens DSM 22298]|uniref:Transposase n=1 Tax=Sphingomonas astaxanthinifaciens DSM 22298 TaxID=1123267 RepID=A0ABQ5ZAL0_9SPHN|nr:hypothetical protein GCM10007925_13600 [Sphingomonas astaxanthinifaciens DSM 22298]
MNRLVNTAKMPEMAMACPAWPSLIWRLEATGVSRLTGMNSDAMSVETHNVRAKTAGHPPSELRMIA